MRSDAPQGPDHASGTSESHLNELRRRVLGYAFGSPPPEWCEPAQGDGMPLPINPSSPELEFGRFKGCHKYSTCSLIPESARWTPWSELTEDQRQQLREVRCYRASRASSWDPEATPSRRSLGPQGRWVGNPFGLRTPELIARAQETSSGPEPDRNALHRDLQPCPVGGCVTPEMQRDFASECALRGKPVPALSHSPVCPFFYRHTSETLSHALPNPLRFAQCYITLPPFRRLLEETGVVVVAPVHRSPEGTSVGGESYWYPFFSGYAFLQVPTRAPGEKGILDPTLAPRWFLTRVARQRRHRSAHRLPIGEVFESAESGFLTTGWERDRRLVSVSEGQATVFLLQWILARRFIARLEITGPSATIDVAGETEWRYAHKGDPFFSKLADLEKVGYDLNELFGLIRRDGEYIRRATLRDDLQLLGILDRSGAATERLSCAIQWLRARLSGVAPGPELSPDHESRGAEDPLGLDNAVLLWLGKWSDATERLLASAQQDSGPVLPSLVQILISIASRGAVRPPNGSVSWSDLERVPLAIRDLADTASRVERWLLDQNPSSFSHICRLVPQMHILVRAHWTAPLRWLFVPTALLAQPPFRVSSGLIAMVEDDITGLPYQLSRDLHVAQDRVLESFQRALPVFSFLSAVEFGCLQDDIVDAYREWESRRPRISEAVHFLREISGDLGRLGTDAAEEVGKLVDVLAGQFFVQLTPPDEAARRSPEAVDAAGAARDAVASFNAYFATRYCGAELALADDLGPPTIGNTLAS